MRDYRIGLTLTTWTDRNDPAWLLVEPAHDLHTSRRNGLTIGIAHRRYTIRPQCPHQPRR